MKIRAGKAAWLLAAALGLLYLCSLRAYYVGFFNDDAFYIIGSRSLLQGRYAELNAPGAPPLVNYPPGYPLLLVPLAWIFRGSLLPYQLFSVILTLGSAGLFWVVFAEELAPPAFMAAALVSAVNPMMVSLSGTVLSEVPALFLTLLVFAAAKRRWGSDSAAFWAGLGALAGFCFLVRTSAAALIAALCGGLLLEKRWRAAGLAASAWALVAAPYLARNRILTGHSELRLFEMVEPYRAAGAVRALAASFGRNAVYYGHELFARALFRWPPGLSSAGLEMATAGLCLGALAWGLRDWGLRGWRKLASFYLILYAAVHLAWAMQTGRYLYPVLPLCAAFLFSGLAAADRRLGLGGKGVLGALALCLGLYLAPVSNILGTSLGRHTPVNTPPERTFSWIRLHTRPSDVFVAELDGQLHLLTGRPALHARRIPDRGAFARWARESGAAYVLVLPTGLVTRSPSGRLSNDPMPAEQLMGLVSDRGRYEPVFRDEEEGSAVFRVRP